MSVACDGVFVPPNKPASYLLLLSLFSRLRNSVTEFIGSLAQGYIASKQQVDGQGPGVSGCERLHVVIVMGQATQTWSYIMPLGHSLSVRPVGEETQPGLHFDHPSWE